MPRYGLIVSSLAARDFVRQMNNNRASPVSRLDEKGTFLKVFFCVLGFRSLMNNAYDETPSLPRLTVGALPPIKEAKYRRKKKRIKVEKGREPPPPHIHQHRHHSFIHR